MISLGMCMKTKLTIVMTSPMNDVIGDLNDNNLNIYLSLRIDKIWFRKFSVYNT